MDGPSAHRQTTLSNLSAILLHCQCRPTVRLLALYIFDAPAVDSSAAEMRPPAAVSATDIVSLRSLRRDATSSAAFLRAGGGKTSESVIMLLLQMTVGRNGLERSTDDVDIRNLLIDTGITKSLSWHEAD